MPAEIGALRQGATPMLGVYPPIARLRPDVIAAMIACCTGCTITDTSAPPVSGPSELALAVALQATPDVLVRDGFSQAVVTITVRDAYARPVGSLELSADIMVNGVVQDLGRLSARSLTTTSDGQASVVYTAPVMVIGAPGQSVISILITPSSGDARGQLARTVDIRLVPPPDP